MHPLTTTSLKRELTAHTRCVPFVEVRGAFHRDGVPYLGDPKACPDAMPLFRRMESDGRAGIGADHVLATTLAVAAIEHFHFSTFTVSSQLSNENPDSITGFNLFKETLLWAYKQGQIDQAFQLPETDS